jgi:hypothetical protein
MHRAGDDIWYCVEFLYPYPDSRNYDFESPATHYDDYPNKIGIPLPKDGPFVSLDKRITLNEDDYSTLYPGFDHTYTDSQGETQYLRGWIEEGGKDYIMAVAPRFLEELHVLNETLDEPNNKYAQLIKEKTNNSNPQAETHTDHLIERLIRLRQMSHDFFFDKYILISTEKRSYDDYIQSPSGGPFNEGGPYEHWRKDATQLESSTHPYETQTETVVTYKRIQSPRSSGKYYDVGDFDFTDPQTDIPHPRGRKKD